MKRNIEKEKMENFKKNSYNDEDKSLFEFWKKLKNNRIVNSNESEQEQKTLEDH